MFGNKKTLFDISDYVKTMNSQELHINRLKIIHYSSQLISLLSLISNKDSNGSIDYSHLFVGDKKDDNIDQKFKCSDELINNQLIDDYLSVIGELIQGLYRLHYKKLMLNSK